MPNSTSTASKDSTGVLLQAVWLGLAGGKSIAATSVRTSHMRPSCARSVRAYLEGVRRRVTMKEIHAGIGGQYTYEEIGSVLAKLMQDGRIGKSKRETTMDGRRVPRDKFIRRYWWADVAASFAAAA